MTPRKEQAQPETSQVDADQVEQLIEQLEEGVAEGDDDDGDEDGDGEIL